MKAAKKGAEKLKELNEIMVPEFHSLVGPAQQSAALLPKFVMDAQRPPALPQPNEQALHNNTHTIVGGTIIGSNPGTAVPDVCVRGKDRKKRKRRCKLCIDNGMYTNPSHSCAGSGGGRDGGRKSCDYFDAEGKRRCRRCLRFGSKQNLDPYSCPAARECVNDCIYFEAPDPYGKRAWKRSLE